MEMFTYSFHPLSSARTMCTSVCELFYAPVRRCVAQRICEILYHPVILWRLIARLVSSQFLSVVL